MSKKLQRGNKEAKKPKQVPGVVVKPGAVVPALPAAPAGRKK
jgi:hypothetical protein